MTRPNLRVRALSLIAVAGLVVTACGSSATPSPATTSAPATTGPSGAAPSASTSTGGEAQPGGTAYILMSTATSDGDRFTDMDPQRIYIGEDIAIFSATIMRTLTQYKYSADLT